MLKHGIKSLCGNKLFGTLRIVPNRFQRDRDLFVFDMSYWSIASLRPVRTEPLAKTGDSDVNQIVAELTLESCNEAASGIVADLTTS